MAVWRERMVGAIFLITLALLLLGSGSAWLTLFIGMLLAASHGLRCVITALANLDSRQSAIAAGYGIRVMVTAASVPDRSGG